MRNPRYRFKKPNEDRHSMNYEDHLAKLVEKGEMTKKERNKLVGTTRMLSVYDM